MSDRSSFSLLCSAEFRKLRGRGLLPAVLLFGAAHGIAAGLGIRALELLGGKALDASGVESSRDLLDFTVAGEVALQLAAAPIHGFAMLLLFAILWAEDFSLGTMAMIVSRPVARWRVFAAKFTVGSCCAAASLLMALLTALVLGTALFGLNGDLSALESIPLVGWMAALPSLPMRLIHLLSGVLAGTLVLLPALSITALLGNLSRSPVLTLFSSLLILLADFFAHGILSIWSNSQLRGAELAEMVQPWTLWGSGRALFKIHGPWAESWTIEAASVQTAELVNDPSLWSQLGQPLLGTLIWTLLFTSLGLLLFRSRDVS
ncbi:MAG: hypothetical protein CMP23_06805 [Rickettsiales bacterium]|nr:hypothetical protein [Rickettsiales bacterium]